MGLETSPLWTEWQTRVKHNLRKLRLWTVKTNQNMTKQNHILHYKENKFYYMRHGLRLSSSPLLVKASLNRNSSAVGLVSRHPTGSELTSDWSVTSFKMVVYEKKFFSHSMDRKFWLNWKIFLFTHESEVSTLPVWLKMSWVYVPSSRRFVSFPFPVMPLKDELNTEITMDSCDSCHHCSSDLKLDGPY